METTQDFSKTYLFSQSPEEVFNAVNNVRRWWSEGLEGESQKQGDEFTYRYQNFHYSKHKLTEVLDNQRVVWLTTDSRLSFTADPAEWTGTTISFDISKEGDQTKLVFTHHGLNTTLECYGACTGGWTNYLDKSLVPLITTGKGAPGTVEEVFANANN